MAKYKQRIADRLLKRSLAQNIDRDKVPAPSFMAVIVGVGQYAYCRKDGVLVIPIGCLRD